MFESPVFKAFLLVLHLFSTFLAQKILDFVNLIEIFMEFMLKSNKFEQVMLPMWTNDRSCCTLNKYYYNCLGGIENE